MDNEFPTLDTIDWYGEKLNIYQLVERLEGAQEVVKALNAQVELHKQIAQDMQTAVNVRNDFINDLQTFQRDVVVMLAGVGDDDHKTKNQTILRAVHDLLVMSRKKLWERHVTRNGGDADSIPF